ncbi:receptor-like protein EIX1 [Oryza glaberrima]|uniref:receptor-like protein EIX1 n=1 Tax=Oryza glaberrima TaxID=4538 RepID=UPI00023DFB9C|nr:receptor-like protein EIX1 [Oryza glaberrima]
MHPAAKLPLLFLLLVGATAATSITNHAPAPAAGSCVPREREALLAFKRGITGDPAGRLASWKRGNHDCCRWRGVRCSDNLIGHIFGLHLQNNFSWYDEATALVGHISTSLLALEHLEHLDLSNNNLVGPAGRFPGFVSSLRNLIYLNFSGMPLRGKVPPQLSNLTKLKYLDLSHRNGIGMYSTDIQWLTHLPSLRYLGLSNVDLSRISCWPRVMNMNAYLRALYLSHCSFTSASQSILQSNFTRLEELDLSHNNFNQPLASYWFWNLTSLKYLDLSGNNIVGSLPAAVSKFTSLDTLDLSENQLFGSVPYEISMLTSLTDINLRVNNLTGEITEKHLAGLKSLKNIDLSSNHYLKIVVGPEWQPPFRLEVAIFESCQLGPMFPSWLQWMVDIKILDIWNTGITDQLPHWFWTTFSKATKLDMSSNKISGSLPTNMETMSLESLYLGSNQITGVIPTLPPNLTWLEIQNNMVSRIVASKNFGAPNLGYMDLSSNNIKGPIPGSICELQYLRFLNLANNHLEGEFPHCIGMTEVNYLFLNNNSLSGRVPSFLKGCKQLMHLDLSQNKFHGRLPSWIGDFPAVRSLILNNNVLSGHIPTNITNLTNLQDLDLSQNKFHGRLSNWIGDLPEVQRIFLNNNLFSGHIPINITNLTKLTQLNLAYNNISGILP